MTRALPLRLLARDGVAAAALPEAPLRVEGMVTKREAKESGTHLQDDAESVGTERWIICEGETTWKLVSKGATTACLLRPSNWKLRPPRATPTALIGFATCFYRRSFPTQRVNQKDRFPRNTE